RLTHVQLLFTWNLSPLQSSKFSFEYLLLPPRSALGPFDPGSLPRLRHGPHACLLRRGIVSTRRRGMGSTLERIHFQ
ncbi:hypothetical protein BO70DRAFT_411533, partial [Aspergillus heteromorphus CBS 117.55]